jgi:hypothetical protein
MFADSLEVIENIAEIAAELQDQGNPCGAFKVHDYDSERGCPYMVFSEEGPDRAATLRQQQAVRASLEGLGLEELGTFNFCHSSSIPCDRGSEPTCLWVMIILAKATSPTQRDDEDSLQADALVTQLYAVLRQAGEAVTGSQDACAA